MLDPMIDEWSGSSRPFAVSASNTASPGAAFGMLKSPSATISFVNENALLRRWSAQRATAKVSSERRWISAVCVDPKYRCTLTNMKFVWPTLNVARYGLRSKPRKACVRPGNVMFARSAGGMLISPIFSSRVSFDES